MHKYVYCSDKTFTGRFSLTNDSGELDVFDDVLCVAVPPGETLGADMSVHLAAAGADMITRACVTE